MANIVTQLVATYGYFIVALFIILESMGIPLPAETALLLAAAYAGAGHLHITLLIGIAACAAIIGDAGGYWLGRRGGRPFLLRYGRWLHLNPHRLDTIESFFRRHGSKAVFFGRFVGVLRTYVALFAGISRMPYLTFTLFNALGGITWATLFGVLGFVFGQNLSTVERVIRYLGWGLVLVIGLLVLAILAWRWIAQHQDILVEQRDWVLANPLIVRLRSRYHRQLTWLLARLTPGEYLGLYLTLGLAASVGSVWLFGGLAQDILAHDPIVQFDTLFANLLHSGATPTATAVFVIITEFGGPIVVLIAVAVTLLYAWRRQWLYLGAWLVALGGGEVLNVLLKQLFHRPRPVFAHPLYRLLVDNDYSFPSGHAMGSLIAYGMLAYFAMLLVRTWRTRSALLCGTVLLVLLIGFSRLYLGVHYFSDVVAGYAAGGVWLSTCITGLELIRRGELSERWQQRFRRWGSRTNVWV
jgi:undecaprenyl-diphosphatase